MFYQTYHERSQHADVHLTDQEEMMSEESVVRKSYQHGARVRERVLGFRILRRSAVSF